MSILFSGYTAVTPLGTVDLVPFLRKLRHLDAEIPDFEMDAGIIALNAAGIPGWRIANALHMSAETVNKVLSGEFRHVHPVMAPRTNADKYMRHKALIEKRHAERVLIDGRLIHPYCEHGKNSAYTGYGCRCLPCERAHAEKRRTDYARGKATA